MDLTSLLADYGPALVFVILFLDSMGLPLPTEVALLITGYLIGLGKMPVAASLAAALAGGVIGCYLSYRIGAATGARWITRRFGISEKKLSDAQAWLARRGPYALFFARFVPFVRCLVGYPAGMLGAPIWTYLILSSLGYAGWIGLSVFGGYVLGENWQLVVVYTEEALLIAGALALAYGFFHWRRRRRRFGARG